MIDGPITGSRVTVIVPEEKGEQLLPRFILCLFGIFAGARQITHRFILNFRDEDRSQFTGAMKTASCWASPRSVFRR